MTYLKLLFVKLSLPFLANGLRQYLITGHDCHALPKLENRNSVA
jgi:hypothetical protein